MFDAPGEWNLRQCQNPNCRAVWLDPFPLEEDLSLAYESYYTHAEATQVTASKHRRNTLYRVYLALTSLPGAILGLQAEKRSLASMFLEKTVPGHLLDVGCGDGRFLSRMKSSGWTVQGVEFDIQAIRNAQSKYGLEVFHGDIKGPRFASNSFDAVTLHHVIEHVVDPMGVFAESYRILKPGGRLVIVTPNVLSLGHERFKSYWRGLEVPRHLHIFSVGALSECAQRAGFDVLEARTTAANADVIIGASYSIQQSSNHRTQVEPPPNLARALRALAFQYREHFLLRRRSDCGEEAAMVCSKRIA